MQQQDLRSACKDQIGTSNDLSMLLALGNSIPWQFSAHFIANYLRIKINQNCLNMFEYDHQLHIHVCILVYRDFVLRIHGMIDRWLFLDGFLGPLTDAVKISR